MKLKSLFMLLAAAALCAASAEDTEEAPAVKIDFGGLGEDDDDTKTSSDEGATSLQKDEVVKAEPVYYRRVFIGLGVVTLIVIIDLWFCVSGERHTVEPYYLQKTEKEKKEEKETKEKKENQQKIAREKTLQRLTTMKNSQVSQGSD
mmetsp:Transcript_5696/g.9033  ORF Transcript_5696/g.9033 Transcript_5696/m.9033 type:complete len:147 (+) Transcript_5696:15-455(+)